jgi:hypothetical protein
MFPQCIKSRLAYPEATMVLHFFDALVIFWGGPKGCGIDVIASRYYCPLKLEFVPGSKASTIIFYDVRFEKTILVIPNAPKLIFQCHRTHWLYHPLPQSNLSV